MQKLGSQTQFKMSVLLSIVNLSIWNSSNVQILNQSAHEPYS